MMVPLASPLIAIKKIESIHSFLSIQSIQCWRAFDNPQVPTIILIQFCMKMKHSIVWSGQEDNFTASSQI
jgi:hypothetical protein